MSNEKQMIAGLIERGRVAMNEIADYSQEQIDTLVRAIAWEIVKEENSEELAKLAVEESQLGNYQGKYVKLQKKVRGNLRDMLGEKSVGIIEEDEKRGLYKIAKPVGVIGALVPCTNPEATPVIKAMNAIKGKNAIVFAPHPRTKKTNTRIVEIMRDALRKYDAPEDLLIAIDQPSMELSSELMSQCDLVVATGGSGMVKAAYSSGTPAYGVGAGNAVVIVDETADLNDAAAKIMASKTFDFATSCSSENSIVVVESVYNELLEALQNVGGHLANAEEKTMIQNTLWVDGHLNRHVIAQPADKIAEMAKLKVKEGTSFLMVEEDGVGSDYPFSGEKMSVVLTVYKAENFDAAIDRVNEITGYQGSGHSCGLHTTDEERVKEIGLKTKTSRVMIRQPQCYGNSGNWDNGMPFTLTLGCGSWGGNISSENISYKHFINVTWVSKPIPEVIPTDEELFGHVMK
ncbi:aldehyde dehydrogenase family protein [Acidaminobacter sp. JC074]|uniref:acylating sulfoacetaldehyde dehydrogenase n=1 Tax=Acidaminobacter sp. JC074 TaxID=2530199 RepID=UPI001F0D89E1|nr:aldehyde dehydrogenase family protein [Acidaminobacter sp. JC074]MCH4889818.1 aldehyde dehydrogenase family protein [Acidaminobacter sp. JC074]